MPSTQSAQAQGLSSSIRLTIRVAIILSSFTLQTDLAFAEAALQNAAQTQLSYTNKIQENAAELEKIEREIVQTEKHRQRLASQLGEHEGGIANRARRIKQLEGDIRQYELKLQRFEERVRELEASNSEGKQQLAAMLQSSLYTRKSSGWKLLLNQKDPTTTARLGVYLEYLMQAQQRRISQQADRMTKISSARYEALKSHNWLQHIKNKANEQKVAYTEKRLNSQSSLQRLDNALGERRKTALQLTTEQQELKQLLQQLAEATKTRSGFFLSRKAQHPWPTWPDENDKTATIPTLKAHFGEKKASGKLKWSGVLISAKPGSPVHAIADGEVVYADTLAGLGELVVLEHGDGYLSLYGGNRKVLVKSEDWVESGATIATVGETGGPNPQGIYLEIRLDAKPLDPQRWLARVDRIGLAEK